MIQKTPLHAQHLSHQVSHQAKMVDFGGWDMPLHYGSQLKEHEVVRADAGMFDVSHMTVIDITGPESKAYLQHLLANDVAKLGFIGKALYSGMLNAQGGVIDDLIAYLTDDGYRVVVNAATRAKDWAWMQEIAKDFQVALNMRTDLAMIAIQGPNAIAKTLTTLSDTQKTLTQSLKVFQGLACDDWFIARTGYTGEDGLEIMLPAAQAVAFWQALHQAGIAPCGLGARDTLRLEAGMNLYGHEMDETINPLAANMAWTIPLDDDRTFIGKAALTSTPCTEQLVGLLLQGKGILRAGQTVSLGDAGTGIITSGTYSPTLKQSIAMARIPRGQHSQCWVDIRGKLEPAQIIKMPFVKHGKSCL